MYHSRLGLLPSFAKFAFSSRKVTGLGRCTITWSCNYYNGSFGGAQTCEFLRLKFERLHADNGDVEETSITPGPTPRSADSSTQKVIGAWN